MIHHEFTTLGKTIRQLREGRNFSQEAFAESCGLHRTYICDVEHGVRTVTIGTLLKLAQGLGTTVSDLTRNVQHDTRSSEKRPNLLYMNSTKLLIEVVVLFLAALSAQAQSILDYITFESAIADSILQYQGGSVVPMAGALRGWNASTGGNNAAFMQALIAPDAGQTGQLEFTSQFNNNVLTGTEFDGISFADVASTPEPSSLLLFGVGGSVVAFYKRKRASISSHYLNSGAFSSLRQIRAATGEA